MKSCPTCQSSYPNSYAVCPQDGAALVEVGAWSDGAVVRAKYRILSKIGQGGMGAVYKALHLAFDELRALKVMSPELMSDELFVKRFKHEAVITRKLQHPNAVRVDDIDEAEDGRPFIVMEFIEGQSLKKLIQEQGPLPVPRVCSIVKQAASALEAAHRLGMVHRDIKPDNIALIDSPEGERAKVLDFGIAKVKEARLGGEVAGLTLTGTGVVIGTPQYMSPEQAMGKRGDELDGRSDLYSLGIVMYQMLTGDLPFKADTTMEMLLAHLQKPPIPIAALRPELQIPDSIARVVMKTLEKNRDLRPSTAQALIDEITHAEQELAPVGATRVVRPTSVMSVRAAQPAPPPAAGPAVAPAHAAAPSVAPAPQATPVRPAVHPVPAARPPAKESHWGLWAAVGILVVALGGGGWYFMAHRTGSVPENQTPVVNPSGNTTSTPATSVTTTSNAGTGQTTGSESAGDRSGATSNQGTDQQPGERAASVERSVNPPENVRPRETPPARPAVDPKKISAAIALGNIYLNRGKYDEAIAEYEKGLKLDPTNATLHDKIQRAKSAKSIESKILNQSNP